MTQENKLELINYLVEELSKECEKQSLTHVVAINVDKEHILNGGGGNAGEMIECVTSLEQVIEEKVGIPYDFMREIVMSESECDCRICKGAKESKVNDTLNYGFPSEVLSIFLSCLFDISEKEKEHDRN